MTQPLVGIIMGSKSDWETMRHAADTLDDERPGPEAAEPDPLTIVLDGADNQLLVADGETGLLVPPRDAQALAASLRRLIETGNLRASLGANGPRRARELCEPAAQIERLGRLLASMVHRSSVCSIVQQEATG